MPFTYKKDNELESSLYYLLFDHQSTPNKEVESLLKAQGLKVQHSNPQKRNNERYAIFLKFEDASFTSSLFTGRKRCHLTIDKRFYELDGNDAADRLKWHYCHYTEEYLDAGYTLHFYFNNLGLLVESYLTQKAGDGTYKRFTRELDSNQKEQISYSIERATDIINELIFIKRSLSNSLAYKADELVAKLKTEYKSEIKSKKLIEQVKELRARSQRYSDTFLSFSAEQLEDLIKQESEPKAEDKDDSVDNQKSTPRVTTESKGDRQQENDAMLKKHQKEVDSIIESHEIFKNIDIIQEIKLELIFALSELNDEQQKSAIKLIEKIDSIDISRSISESLRINNISLEFLQKNFHLIEKHIPESFYDSIINITAASSPTHRAKFISICDFLFNNSIQYRQTIKKSNNKTGLDWLEDCFEKDNPDFFEMLLTHGISLASKAPISQTDPALTSIIKLLFFKMSQEYNSISTNKKLPPNQERNARRKLINFVTIMLNPKFLAGINYNNNLRNLFNREDHKDRLKETISAKRASARGDSTMMFSLEQKKAVENSFQDGSILDLVMSTFLPDEVIKLVLGSAIIGNEIPLFNLGRNIGIFINNSKLTIVINDITNGITCTLEETTAFQQHVHDLEALTPSGRISPHIWLFPTDVDLQLMPRTHEQILLAHESMIKLTSLLPEVLTNISKKHFYIIINELLNDKEKKHSTFVQNGNTIIETTKSPDKLSGDAFGALVLLVKLKPDTNYYKEHYVLLIKAVFKIATFFEENDTKKMFKDAGLRLISEAALLEDKNLYDRLIEVKQAYRSMFESSKSKPKSS